MAMLLRVLQRSQGEAAPVVPLHQLRTHEETDMILSETLPTPPKNTNLYISSNKANSAAKKANSPNRILGRNGLTAFEWT